MKTHATGRAATLALLVVLVSFAGAHFATPSSAPVERLVRNAGAYIQEHPEDAYGYYILGRVHALAFSFETDILREWGRRPDDQEPALPRLADEFFQDRQWSNFSREPDESRTPTREALAAHLAPSVQNYEHAIALTSGNDEQAEISDWGGLRREPGPALFHLGLAYILERGAVLAADVDVLPEPSGPAPGEPVTPEAELKALVDQLGHARASKRDSAARQLREHLDEAAPLLFAERHTQSPDKHVAIRDLLVTYWTEQAIRHYRIAFDHAFVDDVRIKEKPYRGLNELISYEAGNAYLTLVHARGPRDSQEEQHLEQVTTTLATLEAKPNNSILTPIILALDEPRPLRDLIDPDARVCFDLDGDGQTELWPWIRPGTALLVWDPEHAGQITSGIQLFGSVTWWILPRDGYHALDLLDDDRDGQLTGNELDGLALWFDAGSDGISSDGEVIPVGEFGILAIDTHASGQEDGCPANHLGLELADGRLLPTYDWCTAPAGPAAKPSIAPQPDHRIETLADAQPAR